MAVSKPQKKRKLRWIILVLVVLIIAAFFFLGPGGSESAPGATISATVTTGTISTSFSFEGSLTAARSQSLVALENASIKDVYVEEGEWVEKNTRLMRLSDGSELSAEISGTIAELHASRDDFVTAGSTLIDIVDYNLVEIEIEVDEYDIRAVELGQIMDVSIAAIAIQTEAEVSHIGRAPQKRGDTTFYLVKLSFDIPEHALPGMLVEATMTREQVTDAILVPMEALQFDTAGKPYVQITENDKMMASYVVTGVNDGVCVEILSGVSAGDTIHYTPSVQGISATTGMPGFPMGGR